MTLHLVLRKLLVKTLAAEPEDLGCRRAIPLGNLKSRADIMAFDQADGVADEQTQRGLAGLFDNRGKRRLQAYGAVVVT